MQDPIEIKKYLSALFDCEDQSARLARENTRKQNLPNIQISPQIGKLLSLLVQLTGSKQILEIGTFGGYSTIYLAKALPEDGKLITLEYFPDHAKIARENIASAGLSRKVQILEGDALVHLEQMHTVFDFIFIDADKKNYPAYLKKVLSLSQKGTMIVCDNLIPKRGTLGNPSNTDENARAIHQCNQMLATHPHLETIAFPATIKNNGLIDAISISRVV